MTEPSSAPDSVDDTSLDGPAPEDGFGAPAGLTGDPGETFSPEQTPATMVPRHDSGDAVAAGLTLATWETLPPPDEGSQTGLRTESIAPRAGYAFRRVVGRGGCGEVWEAVQASLDRTVAVKRLRQDLLSIEAEEADPGTVTLLEREFRQEALITARLEHPNIVPVHDFGVDDMGRPLLAMKLVKGKPWGEQLRADEGMNPVEYLAKHLPVLLDVAQAISFAHSRGIIHRDLKPAQVMVGKFGEVLLMDWGLAVKFLDVPMGAGVDMTRIPTQAVATLESARSPAGTPAYMATEQTLDHGKELGPHTDIFLLGGMLYRLLTHTPPYNAYSAEECFAMARLGEVTPPRKRDPDREMPRQLCDLAMACLQAHPGDRIQSVDEFIEGIQLYLSGAGKREESQKITEQVEEMLSAHVRDYRLLARAHHLLERARGLWSGNESVVPLREQVLREYVTVALENDDLMLARLQAEALKDKAEREEALSRVEREEESRRRQKHQRRMLAAAVVVLFIAAGVFTAGWMYTQRESQRELNERNALLERQRNIGWDMMDFLLVDLRSELEPLGRPDLVQGIANKAVEYFERLPEEQLTGGVLRQKGMAWRNLADVSLQAGETPRALEAYGQSLDIAQQLVEAQPNNGPWRADLADRHTHYALALLAAGQPEEAEAQLGRAAAIVREQTGAADSPLWQRERAQVRMAEAQLNAARGEYSAAHEAVREALLSYRALEDSDEGVPAEELAEALRLDARLQQARGLRPEARESIDLALNALGQAPEDERTRALRSLRRAELLNERALMKLEEGNLAGAALDVQAATELLASLPAGFGREANTASARAANAAAGAIIAGRQRRPGEATERAAQALEYHREADAARPGDSLIQTDLIDSMVLSGMVLWRAGDADAAKARWREALQTAEKIGSPAIWQPERAAAELRLRGWLAVAEAHTGNCAEAERLAEAAETTAANVTESLPESGPLLSLPDALRRFAVALCAPDSPAMGELANELSARGEARLGIEGRVLLAAALMQSGRTARGEALAEELRAEGVSDPLLDLPADSGVMPAS